MKMLKKLSLATVLAASAQAATAASVPNMSFESGIAPWAGTGTVQTGSNAFSGNSYGQLTGLQYLYQNVSLVAGQTYDFMWRFISEDYAPITNTAFVLTDEGLNVLANVASLGRGDSGWQYFSWIPTSNYTGPLGFSTISFTGNIVGSRLLLDAAVPLPGAALLFGSALLGAGALRRRKMAAKKGEVVAA